MLYMYMYINSSIPWSRLYWRGLDNCIDINGLPDFYTVVPTSLDNWFPRIVLYIRAIKRHIPWSLSSNIWQSDQRRLTFRIGVLFKNVYSLPTRYFQRIFETMYDNVRQTDRHIFISSSWEIAIYMEMHDKVEIIQREQKRTYYTTEKSVFTFLRNN